MPKSNKKEKKVKIEIDFDKAFIYVPKGHHINFKGKNKEWDIGNAFFVLGKDLKETIELLQSYTYKQFIELSTDEFFEKHPELPKTFTLKPNK